MCAELHAIARAHKTHGVRGHPQADGALVARQGFHPEDRKEDQPSAVSRARDYGDAAGPRPSRPHEEARWYDHAETGRGGIRTSRHAGRSEDVRRHTLETT